MARQDWRRPADFAAPAGRRRVAVELTYDGRQFCGWQSQGDAVSVQDTLEKAVITLTGQTNITICGSGRTDSGVHARGQVAHIEMDDCTMPVQAFCQGLNAFLPYSVRVIKSWDCGPAFHARFSAMAREYRYFIKQQMGHDSFSEGLVTTVRQVPDFDLLNSYAALLIGTHDFTTFCAAADSSPSKKRDVYESQFIWTKSMYGEDVLCYRICGNAFLYHMVRSLVGSMLQAAQEGKTAAQFKADLDSCDRSRCGKTAPSDGLYLWRVSYDPEEYRWFEEKYGR